MSKQSDSDDYQGWFTAEQLLELCHEHGFQVSRDQLARWHRELAIPAPKRDHRRGGRGSVSMYEPDTPEILLELCRAKRGRTPLDQIVWSLWWESRPAHMSGVRAHMERIAKDFDATVTTVREERPVTTKAKRAPKLVREALQSTTPLR